MEGTTKGRGSGCSSSSSSGGSSSSSGAINNELDEMDLRRGPWTVEEDLCLANYIHTHGEGRWNSLARCAGLKRTGKSCRLRWLNYLRPDVRRGNITLEEQLIILDLHSRWGNRWSKIAQHLPGRTDNEIKNYWRTRVQKHAKQLKCDVNSKQFKDTMRYLWMPRLVERIQAESAAAAAAYTSNPDMMGSGNYMSPPPMTSIGGDFGGDQLLNYPTTYATPENCCSSSTAGASADSFGPQADYYNFQVNNNVPNQDTDYYFQASQEDSQQVANEQYPQSLIGPTGYYNNYNYNNNNNQGLGDLFHGVEQGNQWMDTGDAPDNLWNAEEIWHLPQQFSNSM